MKQNECSLRVDFENRQDLVPVTYRLKMLIRRAIRETLDYEQYRNPAEVSVTLTDNATGKTVTAALLVNGQPHDGSGAVATFSGAGDTGVEVGVALPADVAQAGSYTGNITFTVTYTEGETTGSTTQHARLSQ